jgi:hypothetical protein
MTTDHEVTDHEVTDHEATDHAVSEDEKFLRKFMSTQSRGEMLFSRR